MFIKNNNKFIGSILIIIGTSIGAGMLAIPIISAASGFCLSALLLIAIWSLMTLTGLLVLEVNLALPDSNNNFSSMAAETLGIGGKVTAWLSCLLLLYSLTAAYIAGNASLLTVAFDFIDIAIPTWVNALLFIFILGGAVFWSTQAVDYLNRGLISVKGGLLVLVLVLLMPHIDLVNIISGQIPGQGKFLLAVAPIFLCSFGFHTVIPSIRSYMGKDSRMLKMVIIYGTTITLAIYLFWLLASLGTVPLKGVHSFASIAASSEGSVGAFIKSICILADNRWVTAGINGFANIAMTTSFLGVTLGLFDFLSDGLNLPATRAGRGKAAVLTFVPPLIFALFYPKGFMLALGNAAIFVAILEIILPVLMIYKLRKDKSLNSTYRVWGGTTLLVLVFIVGVVIIALQIMHDLNLLPQL
jgi:tyrosine-specific transport protein